MALILDAGGLIAVERWDPAVGARLRIAERRGHSVRTPSIVVAEVWRDSTGRQAALARLLAGIEVVPMDEPLARLAGALLGRSGTSNPIDATVVLIARDGDTVLTSDSRDIQQLADAAGRRINIVPC